MNQPATTVNPLGDEAITISFTGPADLRLNSQVQLLARRLAAAGLPELQEVVPAFSSLTVFYDPLYIDYQDFLKHLKPLLEQPLEAATEAMKLHRVPVHYHGPDLEAVARQAGISVSKVIDLHANRPYRVLSLGFVPGFAYLGPLDDRLVLARRPSPRTRVPAGSVAIAGSQTAIYPLETPGGWHLIGNTSVTMFDPDRVPPTLFSPGDQVIFEPDLS